MAAHRVALFVTCLVDLFYPEVGEATVNVLRAHGVEVRFPQDQICCGQPVFNSGFRADAAAVARHTIRTFKDAEAVVLPSGSCTDMIREQYPHLFDDPQEAAEARAFAAKCYELTEYLANVLNVTVYDSTFSGKLTYHDSCHMCRGLGLKREPRQALAGVKGAELIEMPWSDECCGFGGSFSVRLPELSEAIMAKKIETAQQSGAQIVVTADPGCMMHMAGGIARRGEAMRVMHIAQVLAGDAQG
ncbi:MAG: (Fe-S)-binding protein [Chloroflexi bacterium]|nr:(Fe-S)-binding protein [Chloroflexota bacterium]